MTDAVAPKTAVTLCGSIRKDSYNAILRRYVSLKLREAGVSVEDIDLTEETADSVEGGKKSTSY